MNTPKTRRSLSGAYIVKRFGILILLLIFMLICTLLSDSFLTSSNLFNICKQIAVVVIIAYGECMLIIAGQTDLSPGSVLAGAGVISAIVYVATSSLLLTVAVATGVGMVAGAINGFFVTRYKLPPFIVTLGMQILMRGVALYAAKGTPVVIQGDSFSSLGQKVFMGVPYVVILVIALFGVAWFVLNRTSFGRHLYAVGGNEDAARASGVNVERVKFVAFMISGALAGLSGYALMSRINVGQPNAGVNYEFDAIIGVIMGGASFSGGVGTVGGAVIGCVIIGVLNNVLNLLNVSPYLQSIAKGILILIAVTADAKSKGMGGKPRIMPFLRRALKR